MDEKSLASIDQAKEAALHVLLHNARGPFQGLPRAAGWGYPEPYTRDLMISALGFLATGNEELADALRRTLVALGTNQTPRGLVPSLAHDPADRGSSDTTPLFLFGLALYRKSANEPEFLDGAAQSALKWMQYQSPDDMVMVSQLPTSDWRDEQWVMGFVPLRAQNLPGLLVRAGGRGVIFSGPPFASLSDRLSRQSDSPGACWQMSRFGCGFCISATGRFSLTRSNSAASAFKSCGAAGPSRAGDGRRPVWAEGIV
jgi:hypothetical protein